MHSIITRQTELPYVDEFLAQMDIEGTFYWIILNRWLRIETKYSKHHRPTGW